MQTLSRAESALATLLQNPETLEPSGMPGFVRWLPGFKESQYLFDDGSAILLSSTRKGGKRVRHTSTLPAGTYSGE